MSQQDIFFLLNLSVIQRRIYGALVRHASKLSVIQLVNKIRAIELMEGAEPNNYRFAALLDALALKITPDEFSDFLAGF